ncbi:MAG: hypothetical protein D6727_08060 [Gammaproteobacteria bacterium]|nr:MAG: hypothetical protein D6727_08060 [Gammaproteobacteria bacterium]
MSIPAFAYEQVTDWCQHCQARGGFEELTGPGGGPYLRFSAADGDGNGGSLRLWRAAAPFDRMLHVRLGGEPVDTNLFFLFARSESVVPHFHGQVVQFGEDACVYNADLLPRLDPVDHPDYFRLAFEPLNMAYWKATQKPENACASAPANPAIAVYLSPWSIGAARPTDRAELERVAPQIQAYLDHCLDLASSLDYPAPDAELMRARDRRHLAAFFDERLDPRAWKGVRRLIGTDQTEQMRALLMQPLSD